MHIRVYSIRYASLYIYTGSILCAKRTNGNQITTDIIHLLILLIALNEFNVKR